MKTLLAILCLGLAATLPATSLAAPTWSLADDTRYMAIGDSLAAGYGAYPATMGYVYRLYRGGTFDDPFETLLTNAAIRGLPARTCSLTRYRWRCRACART